MKPFNIEGNRVIVTEDTHYTQNVIKMLNKLNKEGFCTKHHYLEYTFKDIEKARKYILKYIKVT